MLAARLMESHRRLTVKFITLGGREIIVKVATTIIVPYDIPEVPSRLHTALTGLKRMVTVFPYWDVSWWVAVCFTIGSIIFIASGLFYWLPTAYPSTEFHSEESVAGGVTGFVGATLFQIGSICLMLESVNENQTGCFGWAVEQLFFKPDVNNCQHIHQHSGKQQWRGGKPHDKRSPEQQARKWRWWPSWHEFRTHYFHEIGFVANATLATGATIFYITSIMSLPGVYDKLSQGVIYGLYYMTYLVGGVLFVISSAMLMLETQKHWWEPAWGVLGWHVSLWNTIGSVGWTLAAAFGYCSKHWCVYQSDLTLLWASVAFTVGSALLWFEVLDKYSIERAPKPNGKHHQKHKKSDRQNDEKTNGTA